MAHEIKEVIKVDATPAIREIKRAGDAHTELKNKAKSVGKKSDYSDFFRGLSVSDTNNLTKQLRSVRAAAISYNKRHGITGEDAEKNIKAASAVVIEEAQSKARNIGRTIADEMSKRSAGAIGKMVAGFVAHEGVSLMFKAARDPSGGNQRLDIAESGVNGAIAGATSGAMMAGPWGAVIGGVLQSSVGMIGTMIDQMKEKQRSIVERESSDRGQKRSLEDQISDSAFSKLTENMSRESRLVEMQRRKEALETLKGRAEYNLRYAGDTSTVAYKEMEQQRNEIQNRIMSLESSIANERMNIPLGRMIDTSSVTDSFAKRGLFAGAQVDVASVNDKILSTLTEGVGYWKTLAERLPSVYRLRERGDSKNAPLVSEYVTNVEYNFGGSKNKGPLVQK